MMATAKKSDRVTPDDSAAFINRELSWLQFARRVLELAEDAEVPLLERVRFAWILGMLHDEFFMKRISGMKRRMAKGSTKLTHPRSCSTLVMKREYMRWSTACSSPPMYVSTGSHFAVRQGVIGEIPQRLLTF